MSADAPLSYFYSRAANPLRRCAPAPPKGELLSICRSAAIKLSLRESWQSRKALTERVLYNSFLQILLFFASDAGNRRFETYYQQQNDGIFLQVLQIIRAAIDKVFTFRSCNLHRSGV